MLDFLSIRVPSELHPCWDQIYCTTKRILTTNPTIIKYWIYIRRDSFYRRLFHSKLTCIDNIWAKLLANNDDISCE